jgi:very-short-patch-repair endonuclease
MLRGRRFKGYKFRRQYPIGSFIVDFYCDEAKLIIELGGSQHLEKELKEKDILRDRILKGQGYKVLRIYNNELDSNSEGVLEVVMNLLQSLTLSLTLSPSPGGRGKMRKPQVKH